MHLDIASIDSIFRANSRSTVVGYGWVRTTSSTQSSRSLCQDRSLFTAARLARLTRWLGACRMRVSPDLLCRSTRKRAPNRKPTRLQSG